MLNEKHCKKWRISIEALLYRNFREMDTDMQPNWANLPKELLEIISKSIDSRIDFLRFKAICRSWRSSSSTFQLQHSPFKFDSIFMPFKICCLQFAGGNSSCLVKVFELEAGEFHLINPFSNCSKIARVDGNKKVVKSTLNMLYFRVIELYKSYDYKLSMHYRGVHSKKVLFCGGGDQDCCVLRISVDGNLGFRRINNAIWASCGSNEVHYDDIVVYKGQYYVVDNWGIVSWVNNKTTNLVQYYPPLYGCGELKSLIESEGRLYVVDCFLDSERWQKPAWQDMESDRVDRDCMRMDMKVYMFDEELGTWVNVESLGNRVFVLGSECCFAFCARDLPGWEGNCIYFMEPPAGNQSKNMRYNVLWVFRLDDRTVKRVSFFPSHMKLFSPSMLKDSVKSVKHEYMSKC